MAVPAPAPIAPPAGGTPGVGGFDWNRPWLTDSERRHLCNTFGMCNSSGSDDDWPWDYPDPTKKHEDTKNNTESCPTKQKNGDSDPSKNTSICQAWATAVYEGCKLKGNSQSYCVSKAAGAFLLCEILTGGGGFGPGSHSSQ